MPGDRAPVVFEVRWRQDRGSLIPFVFVCVVEEVGLFAVVGVADVAPAVAHVGLMVNIFTAYSKPG